MATNNYFTPQKGEFGWMFTDDAYIGTNFRLIDASSIEMRKNNSDSVVLRNTPTEREMLAKKVHVVIHEDALLNLVLINEASKSLQQVFIYEIHIHAGGTLNMGLFVKGGTLHKHMLNVVLEDGACFNAYGHLNATNGGSCEVSTNLEHVGVAAISNQFFSCEADEDSQTVYQTLGHIPEESDLTQCGIENINFISGSTGKCFALPEVYNHSSTSKVALGTHTESLDYERMYYLQSKGISAQRARDILLTAHRRQVLDIIVDDEVRDEVESFIS